MNIIVKYTLIVVVIGLIGYKSVYFEKLSELKKGTNEKFDAGAYSKKLWLEKLPVKIDSAIELTNLVKLIEANPVDAFSKYSNAIGIGNYRYSLVKVTGTVAMINDDDIIMQFNHDDSLMKIKLATEYVYGNALRDASGLVDIKDFTNTTDLNNISEELNKTIRTTVLPVFKRQVKQGDKLEVTGAIEFNKEHVNFRDMEIIPARIKILK
jgi:predicted lipoprotein